MAQWDTQQTHSAAAGGQHQHTESVDTHNLMATLLRHHHHHHLRQPHQPAQQADNDHHQEPAAAGSAASQGAHEAEPEHAQQSAPVDIPVPMCAESVPACQAVLPEARQAAAVDEAVPSAPMWPGPAALPAPASEGEAVAQLSAPSPGLAVTTAADILAQHLEGAAGRAVAAAEDRRPHQPARVRVMLAKCHMDTGMCGKSSAILHTRCLQLLCCSFSGALAVLALFSKLGTSQRSSGGFVHGDHHVETSLPLAEGTGAG